MGRNLQREYAMKRLGCETLESNLIERQSVASENEKISKEKRKKFGRYGRFKTRNNEQAMDRFHSPEGGGSSLLLGSDISRTVVVNTTDVVTEEKLAKLKEHSMELRNEFEVLRRAMAEEIRGLPHQARDWTNQILQALSATQKEYSRLREQLSHETAFRRKLHHEVQDLRGTIRVYCRPRPPRQRMADVLISKSSN